MANERQMKVKRRLVELGLANDITVEELADALRVTPKSIRRLRTQAEGSISQTDMLLKIEASIASLDKKLDK